MKKDVQLVGEAIVLGHSLFRILCFVIFCGFIHAGCETLKLGEGGVLTPEEEARVIDYFESLLDDMPTEDPPEPAVPVEEPDEPLVEEPVVEGDVFVSLGGKQIPSNKMDSSSDDCLWKPQAEGGGSVALLPAKFWGAVSNFKVNGVGFRDTSRDHDLPNSSAFPNGARVHLRAKEMRGKGVVTCMVNGERYVAFIPDLSRRDSNWKLVAKSDVIESDSESDVSVPPTGSPPVAFNGNELTVAPSLATGKMVLHPAGLAASGFVIGKPGPKVFVVPSTHRNGTGAGSDTWQIDL